MRALSNWLTKLISYGLHQDFFFPLFKHWAQDVCNQWSKKCVCGRRGAGLLDSYISANTS